MAKKLSDFQIAVKPRRIITPLEIIAKIIIWISPLIMAISVFVGNYQVIVNATTQIKVEFWVILVLVGILFGYTTFGQKALKDAINVKKANSEKITPLLSLADGVTALIPIVIGILTLDFLSGINEPIETFLIVLLAVQGLGRLLLFIDSFKEAEYYD